MFAIPAPLNKPAGKWCEHCAIGQGCTIYDDRPEVCVDFACLWLESQSKGDAKLSIELRPDKSKVVISPTTNPRVLSFMTMPGYETAWRKDGKLLELIKRFVNNGMACVMGPPAATLRIMVMKNPNTGKITEKEVRMTAPDASGMQWNLTEV